MAAKRRRGMFLFREQQQVPLAAVNAGVRPSGRGNPGFSYNQA